MQRTGRYAALDGIRGLAAILIMIRHMADYFGGGVFRESYLAVDLFFVLSGVVIAHAYEDRLTFGMSVRRFGWIRIVRLWPMLALGTLIGVIDARISQGVSATFIAAQALVLLCFLPNGMVSSFYPLDVPAWSLHFEGVANAVYAAFHRHLKNRTLGIICTISFAVLAATAIRKGNLDVGYSLGTWYKGLARVGFSFFAGVLISRKRDVWLRPAWMRSSVWLALVLIGSVGILTVGLSGAVRPLFILLVVGAGLPLLVWSALDLQPQGLALRVCEALGLISYPLYTIHFPLARLVGAQLQGHGVSPDPAIGMLVAAGMVGLAGILAKFYDEPVRKALSSLKLRIGTKAALNAEA